MSEDQAAADADERALRNEHLRVSLESYIDHAVPRVRPTANHRETSR